MPAVFPLNGGGVKVRLQKASEPADYFVVGFERPLVANWQKYEIERVESAGIFRFAKCYSRSPHPVGMRLDISEFPPDMTYPFPMILLFRKADG
jgi:hypothetical protein